MRSSVLRSYVLISTILLMTGLSAAQTTVYVAVAMDWPNMVATGVTDTHYAMGGQHTAFATVTLTSPSGRTITVARFQANVVTAIAMMPIDAEWGPYSGVNVGREYCPVGNVYYDRGSSGSTAPAQRVPSAVAFLSAGNANEQCVTSCGHSWSLKFQVKDQTGTDFKTSGLPIEERIADAYMGGIGPDNSRNYWFQIATTDGQGQFLDQPFALCTSYPLSGYFTQVYQTKYNGKTYKLREHIVTMTATLGGGTAKGSDFDLKFP